MVKFSTAMQKIHNSPIFVLAEKQNNKNKQTNTLKTIITPNPSGYPEILGNLEQSLTDLDI